MARTKGRPIRVTTDGVFTTSAVIEGLAALAIGITAVCALIRISINRRDAARRGFYWIHAVMAVLLRYGCATSPSPVTSPCSTPRSSYLLSMTATAIYTSLLNSSKTISPSNHVQLRFDARRLEPVGRLFRRLGAALCAAMLVKVAGGIGSVIGHESRPLRRETVYATSVIAGALALAECVVAEVYLTGPGNVKNGKWSLPRLDDQFNGSRVAMILGAVAVLVLALGSVAVLLVVWDAKNAARKLEKFGVVIFFLWGGVARLDSTLTAMQVGSLAATATFVFFVVRFWAFAEVSLLAPRRQDTKSLAWFYIADAIMDRVGMFLVVLCIYYIGIRQKQGLWSWTRVEG